MDRSQPVPRPVLFLEPMTVGRQLDAGFELWRASFRSLLPLLLIVNLPPAIWQFWYMWSEIIDIVSNDVIVQNPDAYNRAITWFTVAKTALFVLSQGVLVAVFARRYTDGGAAVTEGVRAVVRRFFPYLALLVVFGVVVGAGSILIVPGVVLAALFGLAFPAFFVERLGPFGSMGRAQRLAQGRVGPLVGALLGVAAIQAVPGLVALAISFTPPFDDSILAVSAAAALGWTVSAILLSPMVPAVAVVAYFDARVRKEGFDVEHGLAPARPGPAGGGDVNRAAAVVFLAGAVMLSWAGVATADEASLEEVRRLAERAADGDADALDELRAVTSIDGRPVDVDRVIGDEDAVSRARAISRLPGEAPGGGDVEEALRRVYADGRYEFDDAPRSRRPSGIHRRVRGHPGPALVDPARRDRGGGRRVPPAATSRPRIDPEGRGANLRRFRRFRAAPAGATGGRRAT